jgi:exodeoxyribonuclease V gamma subunit
MSLNRYIYARPEDGLKKLADKIRKRPGLFSPVFIITGHKETNDWLTAGIAEELGISGNIFFQDADDFIRMIYKVLQSGNTPKECLSQDTIIWLIYDALSQTTEEKVRRYFGNDSLKRYALAEEIAKLFEKYQSDSPNRIRQWQQAAGHTGNSDVEPWQRGILSRIKEIAGDTFTDVTGIYNQIGSDLQKEESRENLKKKVPQVHFFGGLPYTQDLVNLLGALSEYIEIYIYKHQFFSSGTPHEVANRLGTYARYESDLFKGFDFPEPEIDAMNNSGQNLLQKVQSVLRGDAAPEVSADRNDDSISIHSHYTINREVEGLYHFLISQFEKDSNLAQRDVCVVCPDISKYASAIKTWFDQDAFKIAYTFYDTGHHFHESPYHALDALFRTEENEFTSANVLSLLDYAYIREKFGIVDNIPLLKRILNAANIRHGFEGNKVTETHLVSWQYGFKRLLYGGCLKPGITEAIEMAGDTFIPVDEFEGTEWDQILRLYHFVSGLNYWLKSRNEPRTLKNWVDFTTNETINVFLEVKEYDPVQFNKILEQIALAGKLLKTEIDFPTFRYCLLSALSRMQPAQKSGYGGVRFIQPNPYISAPARVYAFLGMNGDVFPGSSYRLSFDLSNPDNPNKPEKDKHLFLNLLLAARNKLYISYIGRNIKNNQDIPPSVLLEELWALIREVSGTTQYSELDKFVIQHPLHSFSKKYLEADSRLIKYSGESKSNKQLWSGNPDRNEKSLFDEDEQGLTIIPIDSLVRFLEDPIKHYYNNVLGIYYSDREEDPEECELFELNYLEQWGIKNQLLTTHLSGKAVDDVLLHTLQQNGRLPLKNIGRVVYEREVKEVEENLLPHIASFISGVSEIVEVDVVVGNKYRIVGKIPLVYPSLNQYLFATVSESKPKYQVRALVNHKVLSLVHGYSNFELAFVTKGVQKFLTSADNILYIEQVCELILAGSSNMHPFAIHFLSKSGFKSGDLYVFALQKAENNEAYDYSDYFRNAVLKGLFGAENLTTTFNLWHSILNDPLKKLQ